MAKKFSIANYIEYSAHPVSFTAFLMTAAYMPILSFIGDYSFSINLVEAGSCFFVVYAGIYMFACTASGRLFDSLIHNFILMPAIMIFMFALIMLSVSDNGFLLLFYALLNAPKNKLWFAGFYILHIYRYRLWNWILYF